MQTSYDDDFLTIKLTRYEADKIRRGLLGWQKDDRLDYLWQVLTDYVRASEKDDGFDPGEHGELFPRPGRRDLTPRSERFEQWLSRLFDPMSNEHNPYP